MDEYRRENESFEKVHFLTSWENWNGAVSEKTVDLLFSCALELEDKLNKDNQENLNKWIKSLYYSNPKILDVVLGNIIKSHCFNEDLTLYAIKKYNLLYQKSSFFDFLEKLLLEIDLRREIFNAVEESPDVELDLFTLNNFLCGLLNSTDFKTKVFYAIKSQSLIFLKAIKHGDEVIAQILLNEMIICLESQNDLRLWFTIMKDDNLAIVLDLCAIFNDFQNAVLKFFDKFANEIESTYDEELNIQYSHVNLDFENFVDILKLFLKKSTTKNVILEYLESKTLADKNFCFWVDVKACL